MWECGGRIRCCDSWLLSQSSGSSRGNMTCIVCVCAQLCEGKPQITEDMFRGMVQRARTDLKQRQLLQQEDEKRRQVASGAAMYRHAPVDAAQAGRADFPLTGRALVVLACPDRLGSGRAGFP